MRPAAKPPAYDEIIARLESLSDPDSIAGMARFGITPEKAYGVRIPQLRAIAKETGRDLALAKRLWRTDTRETRILASLVYPPAEATEELLESWAAVFTYWEICDACCMNLFEKTPFAWTKADEWSARGEEFVKRAGFVLMARLAVSDKKAPDEKFVHYFDAIRREAGDNRVMVKKGVNWALRQIGKRNKALNRKAIAAAREIRDMGLPAARWIASDALRELESGAVRARLGGGAM